MKRLKSKVYIMLNLFYCSVYSLKNNSEMSACGLVLHVFIDKEKIDLNEKNIFN